MSLFNAKQDHKQLRNTLSFLCQNFDWNEKCSDLSDIETQFHLATSPFLSNFLFSGLQNKKQELWVIKWYSIMFVWWRKNAHHFYVDRLQEISSSADLQNSRIDFFNLSILLGHGISISFLGETNQQSRPPFIFKFQMPDKEFYISIPFTLKSS